MALNLAILADGNAGTQLLYLIAVVVIVVGGALFEKLKQQAAEAQRQQRAPRRPVQPPMRPPVAPPVERGSGKTRYPPPVARPPWLVLERPTAPPGPPTPPRPVARPTPAKPPRRRVQVEPEAVRPTEAQRPARRMVMGSGVEAAVDQLDRQVEAVIEGKGDLHRPAQSLAELRSVQQGKAAASGQAAGAFRQLTAAELRRAIVLNEILGPPLALREGEDRLGI